MSKAGQARVITDEQFIHLLSQIKEHRHPEKNTLIMQLSFKLGLRVQEISLLRIKDVVELGSIYTLGFRIKDLLVLPKSFTKGANNTDKTQPKQKRRSVRFTLDEFDRLIHLVSEMTKAGLSINPEDLYPEVNSKGGKTRELPLEDHALKKSISDYLQLRLAKKPHLKPNEPLIISQKGKAYSPNTLQEHMSLMLKQWAGIERASSHSGRRSLATKLLHKQNEHLKTVQQILGHKDASTTVIYHQLPEDEIRNVLRRAGESIE